MIIKRLLETSTSRIYKHIKETPTWAIVSPYRSERTDNENRQEMTKLKRLVRDKGLGFIQFISRWVEDNINFDEQSLFIPNCSEEFAISLGKTFEQSSVIVCEKGNCRDICTKPFETYTQGDIVRSYNISKRNLLNLDGAKEIFANRKGGPASKAKNSLPFTLSEIWELEQPKPSTFSTAYIKHKIF